METKKNTEQIDALEITLENNTAKLEELINSIRSDIQKKGTETDEPNVIEDDNKSLREELLVRDVIIMKRIKEINSLMKRLEEETEEKDEKLRKTDEKLRKLEEEVKKKDEELRKIENNKKVQEEKLRKVEEEVRKKDERMRKNGK